MAELTSFVDTIAVGNRETEVPLANFGDGCNNAGSNAHGLGIGIDDGAVSGLPDQFTLLDQHGNTRQAQISQSIGGFPYVAAAAYPSSGGTEGTLPDATIRTGTNDGNGVITPVGNASLVTLGAGWVAV